MRADGNLRFPAPEALLGLPLVFCGQAAFEQVDPVFDRSKKAPEIKIMLLRQYFRRGHDGDLDTVLNCIIAACAATIVLPDPTSPWSRRLIGRGEQMSPAISFRACFWASVG